MAYMPDSENLIITLYCWRVVAHCKYSESGPSQLIKTASRD
jgi:hypothetical protein